MHEALIQGYLHSELNISNTLSLANSWRLSVNGSTTVRPAFYDIPSFHTGWGLELFILENGSGNSAAKLVGLSRAE